MRGSVKTVIGAVILGATVLAWPAAAQPSLTCPGSGDFCPSGGPLGTCAAFVDLHGTGIYVKGDPLITFNFASGMLQICDPWSAMCCGANTNLINFSHIDNQTCYDQAFRNKCGAGPQIMSADTFSPGNNPLSFMFNDGSSGGGGLVPSGGPYSGLQIGPPLSLLVPFEGVDATGGGGAFNHMTIPWSMASMLGMNGSCKLNSSGPDPQIFLPVQHIPGAGMGTFQIQFASPFDSGFCSSPLLSLVAFQGVGNIPTLSEWGMIVLALGMATLGWLVLRRQQVLA
ncbi:MAG: IPTL-CTERM sorting domain-containing protein [Acidobacteriia bacterium]|nr:IPTL-CTERM sorting domain-containing protein [Terriglobia bacterium]